MITMTTQYVNDKQTITISRDGHEIGAVQRKPSGRWMPRCGEGVASELPALDWPLPETPDVAIAWVLEHAL